MLPEIQSTHIILFHDKSKKYISHKAYEMIMSQIMGGVEKLNIGGNLIAFSSIAKILSVEEYEKEYPREVVRKLDEFKTEPVLRTELTHRKGLEGMIKGLKRYIGSTKQNPIIGFHGEKCWYQGTEKPLELLKEMESRLALLKQ